MNIIYRSIKSIPVNLRKELSLCKIANEAIDVFEKWEENGIYVDTMSKAPIWIASTEIR